MQRDTIWAREVSWYRNSDSAARRPFHTPRQQCLKSNAIYVGAWLLSPGMSKHRCIHASFAIAANPVHWLILLRYWRESIGKESECVDGAMLSMRKLFGGVHPYSRHAFCDGMMRVPNMDL